MNEISSEMTHSFLSRARSGISIRGVCDVISFDDKGVALETLDGNMAVEGEELRITVLNITEGNVEIEGRINGLYYYEPRSKDKVGLFGKRSV